MNVYATILEKFFINGLFVDPLLFFMQVTIVVFSICCHEYSHAQMALWQGDSTARDQGHLTLNPMKQMGLISLLMLAILGIAWGKVPVSPPRMRHRYSEALTSFAGPLMNLLLFLMFCIICAIVSRLDLDITLRLRDALFFGAVINIILFALNMLPMPPLDGAAVFRSLTPQYDIENSEFAKGVVVTIFIFALINIKYILKGAIIVSDSTINFFVNL